MSWNITIILFVLMSAMGGGGYFYYQSTQNTIRQLAENNAILESAAEAQNNTISTLQADYEKYNALNLDLQQRLQQSEAKKNELEDKLSRHDLTVLSLRKPGLVERTVNRGTQEVFNDFAELTTPSDPDAPD